MLETKSSARDLHLLVQEFQKFIDVEMMNISKYLILGMILIAQIQLQKHSGSLEPLYSWYFWNSHLDSFYCTGKILQQACRRTYAVVLKDAV
jgi:hypothetical protein